MTPPGGRGNHASQGLNLGENGVLERIEKNKKKGGKMKIIKLLIGSFVIPMTFWIALILFWVNVVDASQEKADGSVQGQAKENTQIQAKAI